MNVFDKMGKYWAEIADKNQTERQIKFIRSQLKPKGLVLDLACGTGRHTIALTKLGFEMVGLDISAKLLRLAKQKNSPIHLVRADIRFLPFKKGVFFGSISMDTSLGYLPTEDDDRKAFMELRKVVKHDAVVVLDLFNRDQIIRKYQLGKSSRFEYPDFFLDQKRTVSTDGEWLCDSWVVHDKENGETSFYSHTVRLYKFSHLESILEQVGFEIKQAVGDYEGQKFNTKANRLIIIARAR
jgi:SAM-dependent methyltransferase